MEKDRFCDVDRTDFSNVNQLLETFARYFVKYFEAKLHLYNLIYEGEIQKAGKITDAIVKEVQATEGTCGLLVEPVAEVLRKIGVKNQEKKAAKLHQLLNLHQKHKTNFRRELVKAAFDIFQSFEMQFTRVSTAQGPKKAVQLLAQDAAIRAINHLGENNDASITEGVLLGESKLESISWISIPKTPGFELVFKSKTSEINWRSAKLYEKAGVVIEGKIPSYYDKKLAKQSNSEKYGYRRLTAHERESWHKLIDRYKDSDVTRSVQFTEYQYILSSEDSEEKTNAIFEKINREDASLSEERLTDLVEEIRDELMEALKCLSHDGYSADDRKILTEVLNNLERMNVGAYLEHFKQYNLEMAEHFQQASQQQHEYYEATMIELKKTQEIVKAVVKEATKEPVWFGVRAPVRSFTGRGDELKALHNGLQSEGGQVVISQTAVITGMGGVGKSELARKYAYDNAKDYASNVIWIDAETKEDLMKSFKNLADSLNIPLKEKRNQNNKLDPNDDTDIRSLVKDVYDYFKDAKSLFIFDNAEGYNDIIDFLPQSSPLNKRPYILITSRNQDWEADEEGSIKVLTLSYLTPGEAAEFIRNALEPEENACDEEINILAATLQYFPLALRQATAYIKKKSAALRRRGSTKFGVSEYLTEYEEENQKTKLLNFKTTRADDRYAETVYTTWRVTLKNIKKKGETGQIAVRVLHRMAYLPPDNIEAQDDDEIWGGIELLQQYSMVTVDKGVLSIHRLLQEVLRIKLASENKEEEILRQVQKVAAGKENLMFYISRYAIRYSNLIDEFYPEYVPLVQWLAEYGDVKVLEAILKHKGVNINDANLDGHTLLLAAVSGNQEKTVEFLIEKGADINAKDRYGETPLHSACYHDSKECMKVLIAKGADIEAKDRYDRTPLHLACSYDSIECAKLLIEIGADIHGKACDGTTPLHLACSSDSKECMKVLIEKGAAIDAKAGDGATPLHLVCSNDRIECAKLLIEKGADIHAKQNDDETPLHYAVRGRSNIEELFIEEGDTHNKVYFRKSPSNLPFADRSIECMKFLIENGADMDAEDSKGRTPMHYAVTMPDEEIIKILIDKGANINQGKLTPLDYANFFGPFCIEKLLIEKGAKANKFKNQDHSSNT